MSCDHIQQSLRDGHPLTAAESAHARSCDSCLEAWLDSTVTQALDAKPEVGIPANFAARVASNLPEKPIAAPRPIPRAPHWGLTTATLLIAIGMVAMAVAHPVGINTWTGIVFLSLVVTEVSGIALWLGRRSSS
jgi:hypothetical protein